MCKTTNAGARPRPLLRHVQVNVPLVPPTAEEKKAALSSMQWTLPQHLLYSLPQFVQVPLTPTGAVPPAAAGVPPPPPPPQALAPAMAPMSLAVPMKPEMPPTMAALPSAAPKQRLVRPACVNCRRSKVRCEGGIPCRRCIRLSIDNSCERCEPKKRGRKRKPEMDAMRDMMLSGSGAGTPLNMSGDQSMMMMDGAGYPNKRLKPTLLPPRLQEDASRDSIEQFAAFTAQFRSWREKLAADPSADKTSLSRFLFFCSYLSHMVKDYIDAHQSTANQQQMLSDWLCSNLAEDVHKFVENVGTDIVSFPDLCALAGETSPADVLQVNVEKQVFKQLPMGVVMLPLHPYPFHADAKAFVNDKMPLLLGYTSQQLKALLSDRDCFPRLLHSSSTSKFMSQFWDAIADGHTSYHGTAAWVHQTGEVVELHGTFSIKYKHGLPVRWTMFLQAGPQDIERLQRASQLSLQMAELTSDSDELPSTPSGDLVQDQLTASGVPAAASSSAVSSSSAVLPPSAAAALSGAHAGAACAPDLSMMLPEDAKSANIDAFSSPSTIKDLSTPSSPSASSSVSAVAAANAAAAAAASAAAAAAAAAAGAAAGVAAGAPHAQFDFPMAFTPYKNSFAVAPTMPEKAHPWNAVSADSSVLEMLMAQQPELQFS